MTERVWLVTGCSTGFGEEFIKAILQRGDKAIATARNIDSLKELESLGAATLQVDVTAPKSEIEAKFKQAVEIYGHVDVFIANAGYAQLGAIENISNDDLLKQYQTNTFGALNTISAIMPHFRERKSGFVVINSSMLAWWDVTPGLGTYSAAKAALDHAFRAFTAEVAELGYIRTLAINPGHHRSDIARPDKHTASFAEEWKGYPGLYSFWADFAPKLHGNQPGDLVKAAQLTIDLVRGEGMAKGRTLPRFLPMGSDAFAAIKTKHEEEAKILEEWEDVIKSTDFVVEKPEVEVNGH